MCLNKRINILSSSSDECYQYCINEYTSHPIDFDEYLICNPVWICNIGHTFSSIRSYNKQDSSLQFYSVPGEYIGIFKELKYKVETSIEHMRDATKLAFINFQPSYGASDILNFNPAQYDLMNQQPSTSNSNCDQARSYATHESHQMELRTVDLLPSMFNLGYQQHSKIDQRSQG